MRRAGRIFLTRFRDPIRIDFEEEIATQIMAEMRLKQFGALIEALAVNAFGAVKTGAHVDVLASLPAEHKRDGAARAILVRCVNATAIARFERLPGVVDIAANHDLAVIKSTPSGLKRVSDIGEGGCRILFQIFRQPKRRHFERCSRFRGQRHNLIRPRWRRRASSRRFFKDYVRVRSADPKGADSGAPGQAVRVPVDELRVDVEGAAFEINLRIW